MAGSQVAWGIDIGATALKAIKLRKDGEGAVIETFDVVEHDKFLTEPDVDRDSIVRTSLQKFLDRNQLKGETMLISVAGSKTFARFVKLPPVEPKKIPEIVKFEAIQQIPFPLEQVNWDYQIFANADSPEVEVGIFAMKKDLVAQEMANFTSLKMSTQGVQLAPLALYNASAYDGWTDGKGTVLVDIGAEHTDLVIVDAGRIWLRTINLGGNHFTEALAKAFKQPFSKAETLKKGAATNKYQKQMFQAMRPIFADLVAEISRTLGHYQTSHRDSRLERIIAMGNPFKLPNLQKYIQQELKMEVVRLENFKKATVDSKLAAGLQENILSLGVAYGLALQGLDRGTIDTNLLPLEIAREMIWQKKRPWFAAAAACVVLGCGFWGYTTYRERAAYDSDENKALAKLNDNDRGDAGAAQRNYNAKNTTFKTSELEVQRVVNYTQYRNYVPEIFGMVYKALPQDASTVTPTGYAPGQRFIAIKSIDAQYVASDLNTVGKDGQTIYADDPMPAPAKGAPATMPKEVGDRGFVVTVDLYTPCTETTARTNLLEGFKQKLRDQAPYGKKDAKYYITTARYLQQLVVPPAMAPLTFNSLEWGWGTKGMGQYWNLFVPQQMGLKPEAPVTFGAPVGATPPAPVLAPHTPFPIDAIIANPNMNPKQAEIIAGYAHVTLKFKVHLTETLGK